jgi:hypothetical protein
MGWRLIESFIFFTGKFDKDASRYHPAVYGRKRQDVLKAIEVSLTPLYQGQLKNLHKRLQSGYKTELEAALKREGSDFAAADKECRGKAEETFVQGAQGKSCSICQVGER